MGVCPLPGLGPFWGGSSHPVCTPTFQGWGAEPGWGWMGATPRGQQGFGGGWEVWGGAFPRLGAAAQPGPPPSGLAEPGWKL